MTPPTDDSGTTRQLAADSFAQFERSDPERARRFRAEVNEITRGNFRSIEFDLDPLTAFFLASALDLALAHPQHPETTRARLDRIYEGLVERIAPQCPEMAAILADGFRQRRLATAAPPPPKCPDTVRMDWLANAFLGGDSRAGDMIGLPGQWHELRAAVDRAIEEGR